MKLKRYNSATASTVREIGECTINLNARNGTASLTNRAKYELKLNEGDKIELVQDEEHPRNWYLCKSELGFRIRSHGSPGKPTSAQFSCKGVIRDMLTSLGLSEDGIILCRVDSTPIVQDGLTLYALATKSAKLKR